MSVPEYHYNEIIKKYEEDLINNLRDFNNEDEFLRLWVPDENINNSLINLINSFYENGLVKAIIFVRKEDNKNFNLDKILNNKYYNIALKKNNLDFEIHLDKKTSKIENTYKIKKKVKKNLNKIHKSHIKLKKVNLDNYYIDTANKIKVKNYNINKLQPYTSLIKLDSKNTETSINFFINKNNLKVVNSNFITKNKLLTNFFNILCDLSINLPFYEVKDHLIIKLENYLRTEEIKSKIHGIFIPTHNSNLFKNSQELIDNCYFKLQQLTDNIPNFNNYDLLTSKKWKDLDGETKINKIQKFINEFEKNNTIHLGTITVVKIEFLSRVILDIGQNNLDKPKIMLDLEIFLKNKLEKRLELFYSEKLDENKLRAKNSPI